MIRTHGNQRAHRARRSRDAFAIALLLALWLAALLPTAMLLCARAIAPRRWAQRARTREEAHRRLRAGDHVLEESATSARGVALTVRSTSFADTRYGYAFATEGAGALILEAAAPAARAAELWDYPAPRSPPTTAVCAWLESTGVPPSVATRIAAGATP